MKHSIFFHEDDFRQVELVPIESYPELKQQVDQIRHSINPANKGGGYEEIIVRNDAYVKLKDRCIQVQQLDALFSTLPLKKSTEVSTGITPGEMPCKNIIGYGENDNGIFFTFESDIVTNIWIVELWEVDRSSFAEVLHKVGLRWDLLLIDWNSLEFIELNEKAQIEKYLI